MIIFTSTLSAQVVTIADGNSINVTALKSGSYIYSIQYEDRIVKNGHVIIH